MQEVYQIARIPAYKPWRGFDLYYTTDKDLFEFLTNSDLWLPGASVDDFPTHVRHLAVESVWNEETEQSEPYKPNGTEDWDNQTAIVDGEEICLEMSTSNIFYNLETVEPEFPFILLGTAQVYDE